MSPPLEGIIAALWTPTDASGALMGDALRSQLEFIRRAGVHALMPLGSTGEFVFLTPERRSEVLAFVADNSGGLPLVANVSDLVPGVVAGLGRRARELGYSAVSILPPWYFPVSPADQLEFFLRAADAAKLPVFLYNYPDLTTNKISLETIAAFAERAPLVGVKQSGSEWSYHADLVRLGREKNFVVLTGGDIRLVDAMKLGVAGGVAGTANFCPELLVTIYRSFRAGDLAAAELAQARLAGLIRIMEEAPFPLSIAVAMKARGRDPGEPKQIVSAETAALMEQLAPRLQQRYRECGLT
jgi:4-hydroxy-tetrahydrodipicolinate synthase